MESDKTMFAIFLMEDERGFITVETDHYGPGLASYNLGLSLLGQLHLCDAEHPEKMEVKPLAYLPRPQ